MRSNKKEMDMIHGPLAKKILLFAIPLMGSSILQLLFNAADVVVVGRFAGDNSMAAVGSTTSLINMIIQLFIGLSVGANVVAAKEIGRRNEEGVHKIIHTAITSSLISGVFLLIFGVCLSPILLRWMDTPQEYIHLSIQYLRIYFCGMPFLMVYNFGSALLRAKGDTQRPLLYLLIAGVVNVVLNCIFVIVFHMDVAGVALATVISQVISASLVFRCLCKEQGMFKLEIRKLRVHLSVFGKMLRIGLPAGIQGVVFSFSNVIIQSTLNSFGPTMVSGSVAAVSVGDFVYVSMNAFHQAALSFNGQNMGAGKYNRVDRVSLLCLGYAVGIGSVLSLTAYLLGPTLLGFYTTSPEVIAAGMIRMKSCIVLYGICGAMDVLPGCIRGMGSSIMPMIVALLGSCAFRVFWVAVIFPLNPTIENLYFSYPVSWMITLTAHIICFLILRKKIRKYDFPT